MTSTNGTWSRSRIDTSAAERAAADLLGVVVEAEHMCMSLRGGQKLGPTTVTSALHGLVRNDARTRQEFLALTGERGSRS